MTEACECPDDFCFASGGTAPDDAKKCRADASESHVGSSGSSGNTAGPHLHFETDLTHAAWQAHVDRATDALGIYDDSMWVDGGHRRDVAQTVVTALFGECPKETAEEMLRSIRARLDKWEQERANRYGRGGRS